jgi:hypothetical protein
MEQLEKLVRLVIQKNIPTSSSMVLSKVVIPRAGKVFLNCIYVINNMDAFSLSIQFDSTKQRLADEWGSELAKKVEKTLGVEIGYIHNTIISERQYKEKKFEILEKGFH